MLSREEAINQLKMDRDLCNFNPMTGEEESMNENCRKSAESLDMAIKALQLQQEPWEDTVSREKVWYIMTAGKYSDESYEQFIDRMVEKLNDLPPVTPTRNKGKWILIDEESNTWQCTHCKELGKDDWWQLNSGTPKDNKMDYCPHCGADMRGSENGSN